MPKMENQPPNVVRVRLVTSGADSGLGLVLTSRHEPPRTAVRALQDGSEAKRCGLIHPGTEPLNRLKFRREGTHPRKPYEPYSLLISWLSGDVWAKYRVDATPYCGNPTSGNPGLSTVDHYFHIFMVMSTVNVHFFNIFFRQWSWH